MGPPFPNPALDGRDGESRCASCSSWRTSDDRGGGALPQAGHRMKHMKNSTRGAYLRRPARAAGRASEAPQDHPGDRPKATEAISYGIPMFKHHACWWATPRSRSTAASS